MDHPSAVGAFLGTITPPVSDVYTLPSGQSQTGPAAASIPNATGAGQICVVATTYALPLFADAAPVFGPAITAINIAAGYPSVRYHDANGFIMEIQSAGAGPAEWTGPYTVTSA